MKRSVILTLCIILCLALTLGGTIAYLSDFDGDVNVMTLGQVKIDVLESQRDGESNEWVDYQDHKPLYPIVGDISKRDRYNMPTNPLFVDKIVQVLSNSRNAEAYLRVFIGVPTAVLNVGETGEKAVQLLWGNESTTVNNWRWTEDENMRRETVIDRIPYTMLCYNYTKLLEPGEVTDPLLTGLYMDKRVDNSDNPADGYTMWIDGKEYPIDCDLTHGLQVMVLAQAVQADGFDTAAQAFRESGMNDVDFDAELDLEIVVVLPELVQRLVDMLWGNFDNIQNGEPVNAEMASGSYTLDSDAVNALNEIAAQAGKNVPVDLLVTKGENVTIEQTEYPLLENVGIINDGGTLTINGPVN